MRRSIRRKFSQTTKDRGIARFKHINKDGLQMGMSSDFILCNILCLSFLPLQHSEAERWRETGSVYSSRQWWSLWHTVVTCARKVRGAGKQTDSDTKKYGCSILEKKRGLSPWTGKNAYVVFCRKKGCQEIFNINNRWKYLQTSKIWRLQKATISSGQQLCGLKWKEDSSSYEQWTQIPSSQR